MTTGTGVAQLPTFANNMMPALPQEMRAVFGQFFAPAMDTFGSNFNRISLKGNRIRMIVGGQEVRVEPDALDFVILGVSPEQYCVWYSKKYDGTEGIEPDAVWAQNEQAPANVPASALQKDENGRNQFSLRRRLVIAAFVPNGNGGVFLDLDNLFAFDVGGMSTFGDDLQVSGAGFGKGHSLSSYMQFLKTSGVYPCAIPTKIIFNPNESVPDVRFIPGVSNGQFAVLPQEVLGSIFAKVQDPAVLEMLDWRRGAPATPAVQPQAQIQQQPVQHAQLNTQQTAYVDPNTTYQASAAFDAQPQVQMQQVQAQPQVQVQQQPQVQTQQPQVQVQQQPQVQTQQPQVQVQQQPQVQTQQPQVQVGGVDTSNLAQTMTHAVQTAATPAQTVAAAPVQQTASTPSDNDLDAALAGLMSDAGF